MAFSASTPFPYQITPLTNIVPFTYRDGTTYLETLEKLRVWLNNSLVPEFNVGIDNAIVEFQRGILNAETRVVESEAAHKILIANALKSVDDMGVYVDKITELVNNKTGNMDIQRVLLNKTTTISINPLWPTNHPVKFVVTQDNTGNRSVLLASNISGPIIINPAPGAVTEFELFPNGDGTWKVIQQVGTPLTSVKDFGAKGDLKTNLDKGNIRAGSNEFTSETANFTTADIGKRIDVYGAGAPATAPTLTIALKTGGNLKPNTKYSYRATVQTASGESVPGPVASLTTPSGGDGYSIEIRYSDYVSGIGEDAIFKIYGRLGTTYNHLKDVLSQPRFTEDWWTDNGTVMPGDIAPVEDKSSTTLSSTITHVASANTAVLADSAAKTINNAAWQYGTCDGESIRNAMLSTGNNTLYFPTGKYLTDRFFTVPSGQKWMGDGRNLSIIKVQEPMSPGGKGTPNRILDINGVTDVEILGMGFDGARGTAPQRAGQIVLATKSSRCRFSDVAVRNAPSLQYAFGIDKSHHCTIENFTVTKAGYGVVVRTDVGTTNNDADKNIIRDFVIENVDYNGLFTSGGFNRALNPQGRRASVKGTRISDGSVVGFADTAIEIGEGSEGTYVDNIEIDGLTKGRNGFLFRDCVGTVLNGFLIREVGYNLSSHGIQFLNYTPGAGGQVKNVIANGSIERCGRGLNVKGATDVEISNVQSCRNEQYGFHLQDVTGFSLNGSLAAENGTDGIRIGSYGTTDSGRYGTIIGTRSRDNGQRKTEGSIFYGFAIGGTDTHDIMFEATMAYDTQETPTQHFGYAWKANQGTNVHFGRMNKGIKNINGLIDGNNTNRFGADTLDGRFLETVPSTITKLVKRSTGYTLRPEEGTVVFDGGAERLNAYLPVMGGSVSNGQIYNIKNMGLTELRVWAAGGADGKTLDGAIGYQTLLPGEHGTYQTDGANWFKIG